MVHKRDREATRIVILFRSCLTCNWKNDKIRNLLRTLSLSKSLSLIPRNCESLKIMYSASRKHGIRHSRRWNPSYTVISPILKFIILLFIWECDFWREAVKKIVEEKEIHLVFSVNYLWKKSFLLFHQKCKNVK